MKRVRAEQLAGRIIGIPMDAMEDSFYARARAHTLAIIAAAAGRAHPSTSRRQPPAAAASRPAVLRAAPPARASPPSTVRERAFADEWSHFVRAYAATRPGSPLMFDHQVHRLWGLVDRDGFGSINLHDEITEESVGRFAVELDALREGAAARERNKRPSLYEDDLECSPSMPLLVNIDSPGGDAAGSFAIAAMLSRFNTETGRTVAFVSGTAASGAAVVALSASYAVAERWQSSMLVHWVSGGTRFDKRHFNTRVRDLILDRTLLDEDTLRAQFLDCDLVFDPHTAKLRGFVDELGDLARARAIAATGSIPRDGYRQQVLAQRSVDARGW